MFVLPAALNFRERAILRAVRAGRVYISCSCEPDMFIDGMNCCDQATARGLFHGGLVRPSRSGRLTEQVPAELTAAGRVAYPSIPLAPVTAAQVDVLRARAA